jgi:hypothetical protein
LRAAPPSIRMWYNLTLVIVGEMTRGSCSALTMFLGNSEASNPIAVSIHLLWGATLGAGAAAATYRHIVLTTSLDVMSAGDHKMSISCINMSSKCIK